MSNKKQIFVGCDHAGLAVKKTLLPDLEKSFPNFKFVDVGTHDEASCDYPDFARLVAEKVAAGEGQGLLICGSGIGMSVAANKVKGVRAAVVWDMTSARLSREHNDSNILCLGARLSGAQVLLDCCKVWLSTEFLGGRHQARIQKLEGGKC